MISLRHDRVSHCRARAWLPPFALAVLAATLPAAVQAQQTVQSYVFGTFHGSAAQLEQMNADVRSVYSEIFRTGMPPAESRLHPFPDDWPAEDRSPDMMLVYYSGAVLVEGEDVFLPGGAWRPSQPEPSGLPDPADGSQVEPEEITEPELPGAGEGWWLSDLIRDPFGQTPSRLLIVLETCHAPDAGVLLPPPMIPPEIQNVTVTYASGEIPCADALQSGARVTDLLLDAIAIAGTDWLVAIGDRPDVTLWGASRSPILFREAQAATLPTGQVGGLTSGQRLAGGDPLSGDATTTLVPILFDPGGFGSGNLQAARAFDAGLPQPSIIVGRLEEEDAPFGDGTEQGAVQGSGQQISINLSDEASFAAEITRLQDSFPEMFELWVDSGALNPVGIGLERALQILLADANCYGGAIDGDFGPGSRASATGYFDAAGLDVPTLEVSLELYRGILRVWPQQCPDVQTAAPGGGGGGGGAGGGARGQTAPQPTAPTQQPVCRQVPTGLGGTILQCD